MESLQSNTCTATAKVTYHVPVGFDGPAEEVNPSQVSMKARDQLGVCYTISPAGWEQGGTKYPEQLMQPTIEKPQTWLPSPPETGSESVSPEGFLDTTSVLAQTSPLASNLPPAQVAGVPYVSTHPPGQFALYGNKRYAMHNSVQNSSSACNSHELYQTPSQNCAPSVDSPVFSFRYDDLPRKRACLSLDDAGPWSQAAYNAPPWQAPELHHSGAIKREPNDLDCMGNLDDIAIDDDFKDTRCCANLKWQSYKPGTWRRVYDQNQQPVKFSLIAEAEKGFTYSPIDEAYVCQKKNHFQVRINLGASASPHLVSTESGLDQVTGFVVDFHGVKAENPGHFIKIEQSRQDRSKRSFEPVRVDVRTENSELTVGRLHFSETTSNNMRRKGKPNADQRFFCLVVALKAECKASGVHLVAAKMTEKLIVRASNPGQFETESDGIWRSAGNGDVFTHDLVGIGTNKPDEQLTVHGNMRLTGQMLQPSDQRVKNNIQEVDSRAQLERVRNMRIYQYEYVPEYGKAAGMSCDELQDTGVLAQDIQAVLPDAVRQTGDVVLEDGAVVNSFLVVNKDRIFMENVGAVKELCKLTDNLEGRIDELEKMNKKIRRMRSNDSLQSRTLLDKKSSEAAPIEERQHVSSEKHELSRPVETSKQLQQKPQDSRGTSGQPASTCKTWFYSSRATQYSIVILILLMAACLISISTIYILERGRSTPGAVSVLLTSSTNGLNNSTTASSAAALHLPVLGECSTLGILANMSGGDCEDLCKCWKRQDFPNITVSIPPNSQASEKLHYMGPSSSQNSKLTISVNKNAAVLSSTSVDNRKHPAGVVENGASIRYDSRLKRSAASTGLATLKLKSVSIVQLWRGSGLDPIPYDYPVPLESCTEPSVCAEQTEMMPWARLTYAIPVSVKLSPLSLVMQMTVPPNTTVHYCYADQQSLCRGIEQTPPAPGPTRMSNTVSFTLPVGFYEEIEYNFRTSPSHYSRKEACALTEKQKFLRYTFRFFRYCGRPSPTQATQNEEP